MRLAALPPHEYDRCRREEAKRLGVRTPTLDKAVQLARPKEAASEGQGEPVVAEELEPWDDPVDGADLMGEIAAVVNAHVALRQHDDTKVSLWALHTYCYESGFFTPRLVVTSPVPGCGKSTLFDVLFVLSLRAMTSEGMSAATVYRVVPLAKPTLLLDEADTYLPDNDDLRQVIDSGHKATGAIHRLVEVGGEWIPRKFRSFCPVAIAMIVKGRTRLPATIAHRAIRVQMRKAVRGEIKAGFRPDLALADLEPLRRKAARFAADNAVRLAAADPAMPGGAFNRVADNWRPLLAIADVIGGEWPDRARAALVAPNASTPRSCTIASRMTCALQSGVRARRRRQPCADVYSPTPRPRAHNRGDHDDHGH